MLHRSLVFILMFCGMTTASLAEERRITGKEIFDLLAGNTALGIWGGDPYRQFFTADGDTIYAVQGQRSTLGRWRVPEHGDYESEWGSGQWERYPMVEIEGGLYWIAESGARLPFEMVDGQQLLWPGE